jgi:ubiquinone/menaquinone biosynthesis C-methylase UbiE
MKTVMGKLSNIPQIYGCIYDWIMIPADRLGIRKWRKWATALPGRNILEIGVGTGLNMPYYKKESVVFAVDPAAEMLCRAAVRSRETGFRSHLIRGKAEFLPFPSAAFDSAVGTLVFCTVDDPLRSLGELFRVLKPGGSIRLFEHIQLQEGAGSRIQDFFTPAWKKISGGCRLNRNTPETVEEAGFRIRHLQRMFGGIFVAIDAVKC